MKFTDKFIKSLNPNKSSYRVFEKNLDKGFGVRITPAGSISFFIKYSINNKVKFYGLGRYPVVSIADARERCREARLSVDKGIDPGKKNHNADGNVRDLIDNYISSMKLSGKKSWQKIEQDLNFNCSKIMGLPANEVTPTHIREVLYTIIKRGSAVQANRIRSYLHRAFELGIYHDNDPKNLNNVFLFNLTSNPVSSVPKDPTVEKIGENNLSFDEIKIVWNTNEISPQFVFAIRLLLIYGCRPWELLGAKKDEFDYEKSIWTIPANRIKNNKILLLPITPMAKSVLDDLEVYTRDSEYMFPGRYTDDKPLSKTSLKHATDRITEIKRFTPRDLRRTVKIRMGEASIAKDIRDRIQNHALDDISSRHYDHYDYLSEKRSALIIWERKLQSVLNGGYSNVVDVLFSMNH